MFNIIAFFSLLTSTIAILDDGRCNGFQANFCKKSLIGSWKVAAIIPEKSFPVNQSVPCYVVEFSESDVAGVRWLVNLTANSKITPDFLSKIKGLTVHQRYHSKKPYDVWSTAVDGVRGCFEQVLSSTSFEQDINKTMTHSDKMQLHLLEKSDGSNAMLLQMLWGKAISAVIYTKNKGISSEQLQVVVNLVTKLRGPQQEPKICDELIPEYFVFVR